MHISEENIKKYKEAVSELTIAAEEVKSLLNLKSGLAGEQPIAKPIETGQVLKEAFERVEGAEKNLGNVLARIRKDL